MNIARMYTIALGSFGYTEDEARFLYLVAAHSGYFTCQQFLRFIDGKPGKRSLSFVRKLVEQGHASARPYLRNGKVYHVFARNLYEAIGKDNVRFRRKHSTEYIRTRLAALDFILGRLDWKFLESESEKVRLFTESSSASTKNIYLLSVTPGPSSSGTPTAISWTSSPCISCRIQFLPLWSPSLSLIRALKASTVSRPICKPTCPYSSNCKA